MRRFFAALAVACLFAAACCSPAYAAAPAAPKVREAQFTWKFVGDRGIYSREWKQKAQASMWITSGAYPCLTVDAADRYAMPTVYRFTLQRKQSSGVNPLPHWVQAGGTRDVDCRLAPVQAVKWADRAPGAYRFKLMLLGYTLDRITVTIGGRVYYGVTADHP